jgi:threonine synthase
MVSDEEIISAYRLMASREGIFCEPASAASVAGLIKLVGSGLDIASKRVVCVITGTGLKEPELASKQIYTSPIQIAADLRTVEDALGLVATH